MQNCYSILLLCDGFGPPLYAPRVRSLAEAMKERGWQVTLVTEQFRPLAFEHDYEIRELPYYKTRSRWEWLWKNGWSLLTDYKNRWFSQEVERQMQGRQFDLVLCSTFHTFPLRAAGDYARKHGIPLAVDLRDIAEQARDGVYLSKRNGWTRLAQGWFRRVNLRRRNRVLREARLVTSVSPWHVEQLSRWNRNVQLVYNGYDEREFRWKEVRSEQFRVTYAGKIYEQSLQDPTLLLEALRDLKDEMPELEVRWYTAEEGYRRVERMAQAMGVQKRMKRLDYVPRTEVPRLLQEASVVLVLQNKSTEKGPHGMMTTKFFEALGVEKPVLCVRADEDTLTEVIRETGAGLAGTNREEVKDFLRAKYEEWKQVGYTRQTIKDKERYSRQTETKEWVKLIEHESHESTRMI